MVKKVVTKTEDKTPLDEDNTEEVKKKSTKKKLSAAQREEMLIENFVGLQHAMTNLSIKFGGLSDNISELLRVFEGAARSFSHGDKVDDSDMLKKIDSLLDQNKTIAKGLVLMEGKLRSRTEEPGYHGFSSHEPEHHMQPPTQPPRNPMPNIQPSIQDKIQPQVNRPRPKPLPEL